MIFPLNGSAAASIFPPTPGCSNPSRPSPGPVLAVTVRVVPEPVRPVIDAPVAALPDSEKFAADTPVTASENVTVHDTLGAFVGFASAVTINDTAGAVRSTV